jgi:hypothetical protein
MLNSRTVALERSITAATCCDGAGCTTLGGAGIIDHPRGGRDDVAHAAAGALVLAQGSGGMARVSDFNPRHRVSREMGHY